MNASILFVITTSWPVMRWGRLTGSADTLPRTKPTKMRRLPGDSFQKLIVIIISNGAVTVLIEDNSYMLPSLAIVRRHVKLRQTTCDCREIWTEGITRKNSEELYAYALFPFTVVLSNVCKIPIYDDFSNRIRRSNLRPNITFNFVFKGSDLPTKYA